MTRSSPHPARKYVTVGLDVDVLVPLMHPLEPDLIQGTSARLIHQWGVGLEGVDIPCCYGQRHFRVQCSRGPNCKCRFHR